jgi:transcriptional regulator
MPHPAELLQGTLDLLILRTLTSGPDHGWAISQRIRDQSRNVLDVNQGSLYPALRRLESRGWVTGEWRVSDQGRRARFYTLTTAGKRALTQETEQWRRYVTAVGLILDPA